MKVNPWLIGGGVVVFIGILYLMGSSSSSTGGGDLTVVSSGLDATDTSGATSTSTSLIDSLGLTEQYNYATSALNAQTQAYNTGTLTSAVLDMFATLSPNVDVTYGYEQHASAEVTDTGSGTKIDFSTSINPLNLDNNLLDQIKYLTHEKNDNTNTINTLKTENADLKAANAAYASDTTANYYKNAYESLFDKYTAQNTTISNLQSSLFSAASWARQLYGSDIDKQKTPGMGTKSVYRNAANNLWNMLQGYA